MQSNKAVNFVIFLFLIGTLFLACYDPLWGSVAFISVLVGAGAVKGYMEDQEAKKNAPVPIDYTIDVMAYHRMLAEILEPLRGPGKYNKEDLVLPYHTFKVEVSHYSSDVTPGVRYNAYCEYFDHCNSDTPEKALQLMELKVGEWKIQNDIL